MNEPIIPPELDVRKVMLGAEPGPEGEGVEVYAKNVEAVEQWLSALYDQADEMERHVDEMEARFDQAKQAFDVIMNCVKELVSAGDAAVAAEEQARKEGPVSTAADELIFANRRLDTSLLTVRGVIQGYEMSRARTQQPSDAIPPDVLLSAGDGSALMQDLMKQPWMKSAVEGLQEEILKLIPKPQPPKPSES